MTRRRIPGVLALCAAACLSACGDSGASSPAPPSPTAEPPAASPPATAPPPSPADVVLDTSSPEVIVTGLEVPWGIAFLPDGDALVTERDSTRLLRIPARGGRPVEITRIEQARPSGEGGLMGLALSPSFESDRLVYAYLTAARDNRIVRFPLDRPDEVEPVLTGIPKARIHNGGRIAFGPDGHLYAGTGDAGVAARAQDPSSLAGKVLRMTPEGDPVEGADSVVFSLGHRNVQGIAFDAAGQVYSVEFGSDDLDEVNKISQGSNGGWPQVEGGGGGRFLQPIVTWPTEEASPSDAAIVGDTLYVAALRGQRLWQVPLDDPGNPSALYEGEYGRLRTAAQAPDGSLWVMTSNRDGRGDPIRQDDRILRLAPR